MKEESIAGPAIGGTFLAGLAVTTVLAVTHTLDDVAWWALTHTVSAETLSSAGRWLVGLVLVAGVAVAAWTRSVGHAGAHGSTHAHFVAGGHEGRAALQEHEDAHQKVIAAVGGGGSTIRIWPEGGGWRGQTIYHDPDRVAALPPEKRVAIALAGLIAAPNTSSPTDIPHAKAAAGETSNPGKTMRQGKAIAKRNL